MKNTKLTYLLIAIVAGFIGLLIMTHASIKQNNNTIYGTTVIPSAGRTHTFKNTSFHTSNFKWGKVNMGIYNASHYNTPTAQSMYTSYSSNATTAPLSIMTSNSTAKSFGAGEWAHALSFQAQTSRSSQTNSITTLHVISPVVSTPFEVEAPRVIAMSGDIGPFRNNAPRKAPPHTGNGDMNDNTGLYNEQPLTDGIPFLLLLSLCTCIYIGINQRKKNEQNSIHQPHAPISTNKTT